MLLRARSERVSLNEPTPRKPTATTWIVRDMVSCSVVQGLDLVRHVDGVGQHLHRVPVHRFGEVRSYIAEGRVALVGVFADHERPDGRLYRAWETVPLRRQDDFLDVGCPPL